MIKKLSIMTQNDKELLLKDLCARLPYGVRYRRFAWDDKRGEECISAKIYSISPDGYVRNYHEDESDYIDNVRPYLFPLSSITKKRLEELSEYIDIKNAYVAVDLLNSHHIDYRGLIEKGLAIDATGKNIY